MNQPALFTEPPAAPTLTDRQAAALTAIENAADGLYADEVGAVTHGIQGPRSTFTHGLDVRCAFCAKAGKAAGDKLVTLGLVKRRRGERGRGRGLVYVSSSARPTTTTGEPIDGPGELPEGF